MNAPSPAVSVQQQLTDRLDVSFALQAAQLGVWEYNPLTDGLIWDDRCRELYGLATDTPITYQQAIQNIHPDDLTRVDEAVQRAMNPRSDGVYDVTYRTIGADDGVLRWVRFMGRSYLNDAGEAYRFAGVAQDVTQQKQEEEHARQQQAQLAHQRQTELDRLMAVFDQAPVALGVLRGRTMVIEAGNDRVFALWGKPRSVIGLPLIEALPELKDQPFVELLEGVFDTGTPYVGTNMLARIERQGQLVDTYFDFVYTPLRDADGIITGVIVLATDVTDQHQARLALVEGEQKFRRLIEQAPVATGLFVGRDLVIEVANKPMLAIWGKGDSVLNMPLAKALPELEGQPFLDILDKVFTTGEAYEAVAAPCDLVVNGVMGRYYFDFTYKPLRNAAGDVYAIMDMAVEVTPQVKARQAVEASEAKLRSIITDAPAAIGLFMGRDLIVEMPNQTFIDIVGKGPDIVGKPLREVMPELITENQPFLKILDDVYTSGKMFKTYGAQVNIVRQGVMTHNYYNFTYSPLFNAQGDVYAILDIAIDVTEQVKAQAELAQQSTYLQNALSIADLGTFAVDTNLGTSTFSENVRRWFGVPTRTIPLKQVISRIHPADIVPVQQVIDDAIRYPDRAHHDIEYRVFDEAGDVQYLRSFGKAQYHDGKAEQIIGILQNITPQVTARRQLIDAEAGLRGAIELAQLATWSMNIATGEFTYSPRFMEWLGFTEDPKVITEAYNPLPAAYRQRVADAIDAAIQPGSSGFYHNEHPVVNQKTGQVRIIHAQAQLLYDPDGRPITLSGTAQDVTEQRLHQQELEDLVVQRTQQLQTLVRDLERSNQNLQQFAYVASHDLQEPLRKIQSFGDMLKKQYAEPLGDGADFVNRMQNAAARMSTLIRDLLLFSRLTTHQQVQDTVSLNKVVQSVLSDLDLMMHETGAVVDVGTLPTVRGDKSQLGQLFQNLLSNALKFRKSNANPIIQVRSRVVDADGLPEMVRPSRLAQAYYRIDVTDNGIGFDEKYLDRIFQVFQRLHGKSEFAGTGIGLAICEKVAANHGGAITATSQPGEGATFSVYLPEI